MIKNQTRNTKFLPVPAFLNRVGTIVEKGWSDFERAPVLAKIRHVNTVIGLKTDISRPPIQNINDLFIFRNKLAHPKSEDVCESIVKSSQNVTEHDIYSAPLPKWMSNLVNDREVGKIIKDVEMYTEQVRSSLSDSQLIQLEGKSWKCPMRR